MIYVYTDGGCSGNPGKGGWAYVILRAEALLIGEPGKKDSALIAENHGAEEMTTNNRMELMAVISALKFLNEKSEYSGQPGAIQATGGMAVYTDSQYVQKGITEWILKWKRNSWKTSDKKPVKNQDLWQELDSLSGLFSPKWEWVKGHAGNIYNERCDELTQKAIASL